MVEWEGKFAFGLTGGGLGFDGGFDPEQFALFSGPGKCIFLFEVIA